MNGTGNYLASDMNPSKSLYNGRPTVPISHFKRVLYQAIIDDTITNAEYDGNGTLEDPYVITWLPNDPFDPMNISNGIKWWITAIVAMMTLAVSFASSAYSGGIGEIRKEFDVSQIVATLGIALFVLGFAIGPLVWAPMSEIYGRRYITVSSGLLLAVFSAASAASQNVTTLVVTRFLAGALGSSPLTNGGGVLADIFPSSQRGLATTLFATAPFLGPTIGPIVGGFVGQAAGWRWIEGMIAVFTGVIAILYALVVPETYSPVLLAKRAAKLSEVTSKTFKSKIELERGKKTASEAFVTALVRPWILLFCEPIVFLLAAYTAIIYGALYMFFPAFPIVYQVGRGWSSGMGGLAFIGVAAGMSCAIVYLFWENKRYARNTANSPTGHLDPEARLPPALLGSIIIPVGLYWFAWTNGSNVHWIVSIIGSAPFGFGMVLVFISCVNYLVDSVSLPVPSTEESIKVTLYYKYRHYDDPHATTRKRRTEESSKLIDKMSYQQLQAECAAYQVWEKVDPKQRGIPLIEPQPPLAPLIGSYQPSTAATNLHVTQYRQAIGDDSAEAPAYVPVRPSDLATNAKTSYKEDIDYYRIQLEEFKILNQRYQQERTGLGKLTEHIRKTVSQHLFYNCCKAGLSHRQWIENLAANVGIDTKEELKRARERYLAAQKPMRLLAQWETWLTEMDHAITEGKALGIPECQDEEFIKEDFVKAVLKPSPEWTTAFMAGGNKDPRVTVRMMIKQFREYASLLHPIKHKVPKAAFVASRPQLNGEDADNAAEKAPGKRGRGKSRRTPGPGKDRKQCKVCDQQHELKNCWYAFPHNAPVWWKPRETLKTMAQHRIDSDTDLEQEIRGAKRAKLGTPQIKKSQSTPVEDTVE
ncbi:mfs multidrug [Pyrenophora tritici-repentis]|uniref:Mfs multidrug n=3 Tax=Pyrenophora tritici-repentis TaxID=45151 RepID=A0A922SPR8_9PLEO|nr:mfs multidrug [Pyrenophora tritici-repentis]KAI1676441.1 mfs multidrug [Pyrenophora tritici-repentis]